jgi:hypothetical protein
VFRKRADPVPRIIFLLAEDSLVRVTSHLLVIHADFGIAAIC